MNHSHSPEGAIQIPVQTTREQADIPVIVRRDDPKLGHRAAAQEIWTPEGPVKTAVEADKVADEWNAYIGKTAVRR